MNHEQCPCVARSKSRFAGDSLQQQGKRILLVSLVFLTVGGLVFWASSGFSRERLHKGQPISSWVDRACASYGELEIRQELLEIGPEVVPHLTGKLRIQDTWIRRGWIAFRNKLPSGLQGILPE